MTVWDEVVGQSRAVETLQEAAASAERVVAGDGAVPGSMTHAWLFTGPPGSGRSVAARAFAAALQCERGGVGCGQCPGCHTVRARTHPDVHLVVPEGLSIAVQEMRSIVLTAARLPVLGRWQVVLVEDADRLTEAASNALLKAVEEPPQPDGVPALRALHPSRRRVGHHPLPVPGHPARHASVGGGR